MELIKENIEYEQLMAENSVDTILHGEYVIPDTLPDVQEVLMLDCDARIQSIQVLENKILVDGNCRYTVIYLNKSEEGSTVHCTSYSTNFNNSIDYNRNDSDVYGDAECFVEHMECSIVNERKVSIEGIITIKAQVFSKNRYEIVKDVDGASEIQFYKTPIFIDKIVENMDVDMSGQCKIKVPMSKPPIDKIIKSEASIYKRNVRIIDGKCKVELWAKISMLYKAEDNEGEIFSSEDEMVIEKEIPADNLRESMREISKFEVADMDVSIEEDDMGEKRSVNCSVLCKGNMRVLSKEELYAIEDAYCTTMPLDLNIEKHKINIMHDEVVTDTIIKGEIELEKEMPVPKEIIFCKPVLTISDKRVIDDKVIVEGVMTVKVMYKTNNEEIPMYSVEDDIPFTSEIQCDGAKPEMQVMARSCIENSDCEIEGNVIAVKAVIKTRAMVSYTVDKDLLVDLKEGEGDLPKKKASIIIYSVQKGDTLWKIAKQYNTTVEKILQFNDIDDPDNLQIGTKLIIQGRAVL
ncbi:LysM repeat-containing protein [Hathewaya proteolytica DSM 3090]|uniref:LysM repeat-containing protein n=1 Tax=Hathewaya proteolytica DSM 3090 TaxID=1121331 RepID=A0A1M6S7V3_9CLOT|nr:SPOCS domain-containing protein [Hathewaya proteolytica]SHK40607.1 LysM repeat-containing protein [Hathewaya proteolytica DSM 3090]